MVGSGLLEREMRYSCSSSSSSTSSSSSSSRKGRRGADRTCLQERGVAWGGGCSFGRHAWSGMRHGGSWIIRSKDFGL